MLDRLRRLANQPIHDRDRLGLFAGAVVLIIVAAVVLAFLHDPDPTPSRAASSSPTAEQVRAYAPGSLSGTPAATAPAAPSEESDLPAASRPRPDDVERGKRAARRFLRQYLAYSYGRAPASTITAASDAIRDELDDARPRVPADERRRRPHIELLQTNGVSRERTDVSAVIDDGARRYTLRLQLANTAAGWLVTAVER